jgi:hypothetical protein
MREKTMRGPYLRLLMMIVLSFLAMYGLMYSMVNTFGNVYSSRPARILGGDAPPGGSFR